MRSLRVFLLCGIAAASLVVRAGNRTVLRPSQVDIGVPDTLSFILADDFTGDGKPDVLFSDGTDPDPKIRVLPGLGDGTFAPAVVSSRTDCEPRGTADFNGDGRPDLYLIRGDNAVAVMLGVGNGSFAPPTVLSSAVAVEAVVAGDFTGDTFQDLAIVSDDNDQIVILAGNGTGAFPSQQSYATPLFDMRDVAAGDFDADGRPDLAIILGTSVRIAWNNGASFATQSFALAMTDAVAGDVNGDGITDLALFGTSSAVLFGKATRALTSVPLPGTALNVFSAGFLALAAMDGDGRADILGGGGAVTVLTHDGSAFRTPRSFSVGDTTRALAAADFDGNGQTDLAGLSGSSDSTYFWILRGKGDGSLHADATFDVGGSLRAAGIFGSFGPFGEGQFIADLTGDGKNDFVTATSGQDQVAVLAGNGDGTFGAPILTMLPANASVSALYRAPDLNGDGRDDAVMWDPATNSGTRRFWSLFSQTNGTFVVGPLQTGPNVSHTIEFLLPILDYTGDGKPDLLEENGQLLPGLGNGTFGTAIDTGVDTELSATVADLNGDSLPDVLAVIDNDLRSFLNTGAGTFAAPVSDPLLTNGGASLSAGDVNGDGFADVTSSPFALGAGNGTFPPGFALNPGTTMTGDFDGDGKTDLGSNYALYFGTGTGAFDHASQIGISGRILSVDDIDGDGTANAWIRSFDGWLTVVRTMADQAFRTAQPELTTTPSSPIPYGKIGIAVARPAPSPALPFGAVLYSIPPGPPLGLVVVDSRYGTAKWWVPAPEMNSPVTYAAHFTGDALYLPSDFPPLTIASTRASSTTRVSTATTSYVLGSSIGIGSTVSVSTQIGSPPSGTITVRKNGELLRTLTAPSQGFTITDPAVFPLGTHTLTAEYSGDVNFLPSSSEPRTITIVKPSPTIVFTDLPSSVTTEQQLSLTATFPNHPNVTGSVTFSCFGQTLGTTAIAGAQAVLSTQLPWGEGTCRASYGGDSQYGTASDTTSTTVYYAAMPAAPIVIATRSGNHVHIQLSPISGAVSYDLHRSVDGGPTIFVRTISFATSHDDYSMPTGTKIAVYSAVARSQSGTVTPMGTRDLASFITFIDDPIAASTTTVKAAHVTELQTAVNAVRIAAGLTATTFTAPTGTISAAHLTSLRTALTQARNALGLATPLTDPTITPGVTKVRAVHFQELREAMK